MKQPWMAGLALALAAPAFAQEEAAETAPAEEAPAEEPTEAREPWALYVGADHVSTTLSLSVPPTDPADEFDSTMLRVRAGAKVLEAVGFELHYGVDRADEAGGEVATDRYYGAYLVPSATLLDTLELHFPVGYGRSEFGGGDALGSVAYGIDAELPVRMLWPALPDLRLTAGWMVYYQKGDARVYGANFGLRWDFSL